MGQNLVKQQNQFALKSGLSPLPPSFKQIPDTQYFIQDHILGEEGEGDNNKNGNKNKNKNGDGEKENVYYSRNPIQVTRYLVLLQPTQLPQFLRSLAFRRQHPSLLIQILYGQLMSQQKEYIKLHIYTERIVMTLEDGNGMHFNDILPTIYWSISALEILKGHVQKEAIQQYTHNKQKIKKRIAQNVSKGDQEIGKYDAFMDNCEQSGCFEVTGGMIGFNYNGEIKVWHNVKHTKCRPPPTYNYNVHKDGTEGMLQNLISLFKCKVDKSTIPHNFIMQQPQRSTLNAYKLYIQTYVNDPNHIPHRVPAVLDKLVELGVGQSGDGLDEPGMHMMKDGSQVKISYGNANPEMKSTGDDFQEMKRSAVSININNGNSTSRSGVNFNFTSSSGVQPRIYFNNSKIPHTRTNSFLRETRSKSQISTNPTPITFTYNSVAKRRSSPIDNMKDALKSTNYEQAQTNTESNTIKMNVKKDAPVPTPVLKPVSSSVPAITPTIKFTYK